VPKPLPESFGSSEVIGVSGPMPGPYLDHSSRGSLEKWTTPHRIARFGVLLGGPTVLEFDEQGNLLAHWAVPARPMTGALESRNHRGLQG